MKEEDVEIMRDGEEEKEEEEKINKEGEERGRR